MNNFEKKLELCLAKLNKDIDLDWSEIATELGIDCSSDHLRKTAYGIKECYEYFMGKTKEQLSDEQYEKLLQKELEIKKEKVKLQDMRTQLNRQIREQARKENVEEILESKLESLPTNVINMNTVERETSHKDGILLVSDIHYGLETYNAMSPYNSDICIKKLNYLVDKTIEYATFNNIDKLHVLILGDELSGLIHTTTRLEQREDIITQIIEISNLLSDAIYKLSYHIPFVTVGLAQGNHTRAIANKLESLERENFTKLIKKYIELRLSNVPNLVILDNKFDEGIIEINVKGYNVIGLHGHNDSLSRISKLTEMFDYKVDYVFMGHYHNAREFENNKTEVIVNGCFSSDDYAKNKRLYNKPIQKFMIFTDEGRIATYNINLDNYKN